MSACDGQLYRAAFPLPGLGSWDADVYVALVRAVGGPALELGCGTGRILSALLAAGIDAEGLELDPSMRASAVDRLAAAGHLDAADRVRLGDMRGFDVARRYNAILLPDNSVSLLHSDDDVVATLERVAAHLGPGGELLVDQVLLDRAPTHEQWPPKRAVIEEVPVDIATSGRFDAAARTYTLTVVATASAAETRRIELTLKERTAAELLSLLERGGFLPRAPPVDERGLPVGPASHLMVGRFTPIGSTSYL